MFPSRKDFKMNAPKDDITFNTDDLAEPDVSVIGTMLYDEEIRADGATAASCISDYTATCTWAECCDSGPTTAMM
jgi:hypothetical protein